MARRELLSAPPWLHVAVEDVRLPSGRIVNDFYQVTLPDFAVVVPITSEGMIVTLLQYKHGIGRVSTLLPAGLMEEDEEPLACARRELLEETGYASSRWHGLGTFIVDGNRGCGRANLFAALEARRTAEPRLDELEPLVVRVETPQALRRAALDGGISALAHVSALMLALDCGLIRR